MTKISFQNKQIVLCSISALTPYQNNARIHSDKQVQQIASSIKAFGFLNPVLVDGNNTIIAGHGRVLAAKHLGMSEVPTLRIDSLSDAEKRAYILADNRLAEKAGWDDAILAIELQHLLEVDTAFDITCTGFEMPEIDLIIGSNPSDDEDTADNTPPVAGTSVTTPGDVWLLGEHRIFCGSALEAQSYTALMGDEKAQVVFTDPPYNVPIDGHVCGNGKAKHREFAMASGEMDRDGFIAFLNTFMQHTADASADGSIHYICMDWRHMAELLSAGDPIYSELKNICVWNKDNGGMGSLYRSKHEMVAVFKNGKGAHINNIELGKHGRYRTNVWDYRGANSQRKGGKRDLELHPTVKPVAMVADALLDCSKRNGLALDPFGGSGTTLMAAEKVKRRARLIELDPLYVDVTIRRWQAYTGQQAIRKQDGCTFDAVEGENGHE